MPNPPRRTSAERVQARLARADAENARRALDANAPLAQPITAADLDRLYDDMHRDAAGYYPLAFGR